MFHLAHVTHDKKVGPKQPVCFFPPKKNRQESLFSVHRVLIYATDPLAHLAGLVAVLATVSDLKVEDLLGHRDVNVTRNVALNNPVNCHGDIMRNFFHYWVGLVDDDLLHHRSRDRDLVNNLK